MAEWNESTDSPQLGSRLRIELARTGLNPGRLRRMLGSMRLIPGSHRIKLVRVSLQPGRLGTKPVNQVLCSGSKPDTVGCAYSAFNKWYSDFNR